MRDADGDTAAARLGLRVGVKSVVSGEDRRTATPTYTATATIPAAPMEAALVVPDTPTATRTPEVAAQSTLSTPTPTNTPIYGPVVHRHGNIAHGFGAHSVHDENSSVTHHEHTHNVFRWVEPNTRRYGRNTPTPRALEVQDNVSHWHKHDMPRVDSTPSLFGNYVGWSPRLSISFVRNRNSSSFHTYVINDGNRPVRAELIGPDGSVIRGSVQSSQPHNATNWKWVLEGVSLDSPADYITNRIWDWSYSSSNRRRASIPFSNQYGYTITDPYSIRINGPSHTRGSGGSYNLTLRLTDADNDFRDYRLSVRVVTATPTPTSTPTVTPTPTYTATPSPRPPLFSVDKPNPLVGQSVTLSADKPADNAHHGDISQSQTRYEGVLTMTPRMRRLAAIGVALRSPARAIPVQ